MTAETLGDLARASVDWHAFSAPELAAALTISKAPAGDLQSFLSAVIGWWMDAGTDRERRSRRHWVDSVAEEFLRTVGPSAIASMAQDVATTHEQLRFLELLANASAGRFVISEALDIVASRIAATIPKDQPSDLEYWLDQCVRLVDMLGTSPRSAERMASVLTVLPKWAIETLLNNLTRLEHYENYFRELAFALALASGTEVRRAVAHIGCGKRTPRQTELLRVLAHRTNDATHEHAPGSLAPEQAASFLRQLEEEVPTELSQSFRTFLDSQRSYEREIVNLLAAYLAAVPRNHEDVIDFLTRHGTRQRGHALASWGGASVTTSTYGSMRLHSLHYRGDNNASAPSPDFRAGDVFKALPLDSIATLIRSQDDPVFALAYVNLFSRRPDFAEIANAIVNDAKCVSRWEQAGSLFAAQVLARLEKPSWTASAFRELRLRLTPKLLPNVAASFLETVLRPPVPEELYEHVRGQMHARLRDCSRLDEVRPIVSVLRNLGLDDGIDLSSIDVQRFASIPPDPDRRRWFNDLARLNRDAGDICDRILDAVDRDRLMRLVTDPLPALDDDWSSIFKVPLMTKVITRCAAYDPDGTAQGLNASAQQDFNSFWSLGLDTGGFGEMPSNAALGPADRWLDAIATAAPFLVSSYAAALVRAPTSREAHARQSIVEAAPCLTRWLSRRGIDADDNIWQAAEDRIRETAEGNDVDTAAAVATIVLPGDPQRLRALRELAVVLISASLRRKRIVSLTGALSKFRDLLSADAPELARELHGV